MLANFPRVELSDCLSKFEKRRETSHFNMLTSSIKRRVSRRSRAGRLIIEPKSVMDVESCQFSH